MALDEPTHVIGCDVAAQSPSTCPTPGVVAIVMLKYPQLEVISSATYQVLIKNPYQTGHLAKREGDSLLTSLTKFFEQQDDVDLDALVLFIDGAGKLHPREHGLACHVGEHLDVATIGITKKYLIGQEMKNASKMISYNGIQAITTEMWLNNKMMGWKVQKIEQKGKKKTLKPIYVSVGHSLSLTRALFLTVGSMRYRIPEPLRLADHLARHQLRQAIKRG